MEAGKVFPAGYSPLGDEWGVRIGIVGYSQEDTLFAPSDSF